MTSQNFHYSTGCGCGNIRIELTLQLPVEQLPIRDCDCDFCQARQLSWLSHPQMQCCITAPADALIYEQQGSRQADFVKCSQCQKYVAVTIDTGERKLGAVNANLLPQQAQLERVKVSPRLLSADEKNARWQKVWGAVVITSSCEENE